MNLSDQDNVSVKVKTRQNTTDLKIEEKVDNPLNLPLESRVEIKIRTRRVSRTLSIMGDAICHRDISDITPNATKRHLLQPFLPTNQARSLSIV